MLAARPLSVPLPRLEPALAIILVLALVLALVGPFDLPIAIASQGLAPVRVLLIATLTLAGAACADRAGLRIGSENRRWPLFALAAGVGVAVYVCLVDGFLFRHQLPAEYLRALQGPLSPRLSYYIERAFQENVIYRLFVFSLLTLAVAKARGVDAGQFPLWLVWAIAIATQALNVSLNISLLEPSPTAMLGYNFIRYVIPGALWGWTYWRFGFAAAELAHVSCHFVLQPALGAIV
ncbi:MAG TPA: hypothetical protein VLC74_00830 [Rhizomicrobium sp.]|nr:hypothetical protein [Rhizomicrobium sp.]